MLRDVRCRSGCVAFKSPDSFPCVAPLHREIPRSVSIVYFYPQGCDNAPKKRGGGRVRNANCSQTNKSVFGHHSLISG